MNIDALKEYSQKRGLNLGQAEKDYYQNLLLFIIYRQVKSGLVFKGGTALSKCYGLNRFSEDLDFSAAEAIDFRKTTSDGLSSFGVRHRIRETPDGAKSQSFMAKIEGPLYKNSEKTLCSITLETSFRETLCLPPIVKTIGHHMDIIPVFDVLAMPEPEIMAEKSRAVMMRDSARDIYDLCFLIDRGTAPDREMIEKKLAFAGLKYSVSSFSRACKAKRRIWQPELKSLVKNVPDFDECLAKVLNAYSKI